MTLKALLTRDDIPDDVKETIRKGVSELQSQQYISQQIADFEAVISQLDRFHIIQGAVDFINETLSFFFK